MGKRNIIHKLFHNLKKPEGFWGRVILREMNKRHTLLSEWGMSHIVWNKEWNVLDIGCGGGANLTQLMHRCPQGKADRKSTRLNSSHDRQSRMPSSA